MSWTGLWLWQCYLNSGIFSGIDSGTFSETYKCNIDINDRIIQERLLYNFFPKISTSEVFFFFFTIKQRIYRKKDKDRILKQNNSTEIFSTQRVLGLSAIEIHACVFGVANFHHTGFSFGFTWLRQIQVYIIQLFRWSFFSFLRRPKQKCQKEDCMAGATITKILSSHSI